MEKEIIAEGIYTHNFSPSDLEVIQVKKPFNKEIRILIKENYKKHGFGIFEFSDSNINSQYLKSFSDFLMLGEPYTPSIYKNVLGFEQEFGFNRIAKKSSEFNHKAFTTSAGQDFHVDGTLEEIGTIKTTILYCENPGITGGENMIFNAAGAFYALLKSEPEKAALLMNTESLKRESNIGNEFSIGPAFAIRNQKIISRFSLDNTCNWSYGINKIEGLEKALLSMKQLSRNDSQYFISFKLKSNQGVIMANDKISHGRTEFVDSDSAKRVMLRGLFKRSL